jgi:hypothetical protein
MTTKVRKQVYLEKRQDRLLKQRARTEGVSEAALIRRALDVELPRRVSGGTNPAALDEFLELSRRRAAMGPLPGKRTWTRDDLYEERLSRHGKRIPD